MNYEWMRVENADAVPSPALLVYPDRVAENLDRMVRMVGDPTRLRPHVKTHKTPQIVELQLQRGITKCKCATIAEAEMAARAGATDILLAAQPVGPAVSRLLALVALFPHARFSTIVDAPGPARTLSEAAAAADSPIDVFVDLEVGQQRTGIAPGPEALELCATIASLPGLAFAGLHAYDGHIRLPDPVARGAEVDAIHARIESLRVTVAQRGIRAGTLVAGGTPTFPLHARRGDVECSPGTCVLWDAGYAEGFGDLDFRLAAVLLARVVSRPAAERICLDLGHKSVASEMSQPRVLFPDLPEAVAVVHSEEHLVLATPAAERWPVGSIVYGIPRHICPTVALHQSLHVVENRRVVDEWPVTARQRRLTV